MKELDEYIYFLRSEKGLSTNAIDTYYLHLCKFLEYFKNNYVLSSNQISSYIRFLNSSHEATSINNYISSIKGFYSYLFDEGKIKENPMINIKSMRTDKLLPKYLTIEEVDALLNINMETPFDYRNKAMLELIYATGLRVSELVNLNLNSIDRENCILRTMTKGSKERIIPIGDIALKYVIMYIDKYRDNLIKEGKENDCLFLNNHGNRITRNGFNYILNDIQKKQHIDSYLTPHVLRHSFATHMIQNGADVRSVQELLGHENVVTTEIYTHLANEYLKDNYIEYHPRNKKE